MQLFNRYSCGAALFAVALLCSACSDERDQPVSPITTDADKGAVEVIVYTEIPTCDEYFSIMQACTHAKLSAEDQQKLKMALEGLKQNILMPSDREIFELQCQKALENIDTHKSKIGC